MTSLVLSVVAVIGCFQANDIQSYVQTGIRDATFVAEIVTGNQTELKKINEDFGKSFRYKTSTFSLKEPLMLRVDTKVEDTNISYIVNGTTQWFKLGGGHVKIDLSKSPGKRQSTLDVGILTPALVASLFDAAFVSPDPSTGCGVFDLTFKQKDLDPTRFRVWVDATRKFVVKREWYSRTGALRATFTYSDPVQVSGLWFPTKVEVRNAEGTLAGVTKYEDIKVNTGLADSLFTG